MQVHNVCRSHEAVESGVRPQQAVRGVFYSPAHSFGGQKTAPVRHALHELVSCVNPDTVRRAAEVGETLYMTEVPQRLGSSFPTDFSSAAKGLLLLWNADCHKSSVATSGFRGCVAAVHRVKQSDCTKH